MRIARLINMMLILLRKDLVSARELAVLLEVTERTIYRDVEALSLAGLPIYTVQGRQGGIGLLPNYKIAQNFLTATDVRNLLTALASVQALIETPEIKATVQKLQAMFATDPEATDLLIEDVNWQGAAEIKVLAQQFSQAIKQHRLVTFMYSDRTGALSQRRVEPYRLAYKGDRWYLQAYSRERQDFRTFRLARMQAVQLLVEEFTPRTLPLERLAFTDKFSVANLVSITLRAANSIRDVFSERYGSTAIKQLLDGHFEATITLPNNEAAYRFILSLGNKAEIIAGDVFRAGFEKYLAQVAQIYNKSDLK